MSMSKIILDAAGREEETPWYTNLAIIRLAVQTASINVNHQACCWGKNGFRYYTAGSNGNVSQYNLLDAYSIPGTFNHNLNVGSQAGQVTGMTFRPDGTRMFLLNDASGEDKIFQYNLYTPWEISTAVYTDQFFDVDGAISNDAIGGFCFSTDGTRMFVNGTEGVIGNFLYQLDLSEAFNVTTLSYNNVKVAHADIGGGQTHGIKFSPEGYDMYLANTGDDFFHYKLRTPFDISTIDFTSIFKDITYSTGGNNFSDGGFDISHDGKYILNLDLTDDLLYRHDVGPFQFTGF